MAPPRAVADVYLPAAKADGARFCLNPDSDALRADLARGPFAETDTFDATALAEDVHELHDAMKKHYAGYPVLLQDPTFDVEAFFADWERALRGAGPFVTFAKGILEPLVLLRHHIRDNHLSVRGWGGKLLRRSDLAYSEYQAPGRVQDVDQGRCDFGGLTPIGGTLRVVPLLGPAGVSEITTFSAQSTANGARVTCGGRTTPFERREAKRSAMDDKAPAYETRAAGGATVIVVRRLSGSPQDLALLDKLPAEYDAHRARPVIVFDFRGNGGGNDGYVYRWIDKAKRGTWPSPYVERQVAGGHTRCADWNARVVDQITYGRVDTAEAKAERAALWVKLGAEAGAPPKGGGPKDATETSAGKTPYDGRIFVLVDAGAGSSGESGPEALKFALGATIVGQRTAGYMEFGNQRPHVMARTGIVWQMGSKQNHFDAPHDGVGIPVDVYLSPELLSAPAEELVPRLQKLPRSKGQIGPHSARIETRGLGVT